MASLRGISPPLFTFSMISCVPSTKHTEAVLDHLDHLVTTVIIIIITIIITIISLNPNNLHTTLILKPQCLVSARILILAHNFYKQFDISEAEARAANEKQRQEEQLNVTRHKVETLRKIMEERKAKREARRLAAAAGRVSGAGSPASPASYSTAWSVSEAKSDDCDDKTEGEHFLQPEPVTA